MVPYDPDHLSKDPETGEAIGAWIAKWTNQSLIDYQVLAIVESDTDLLDDIYVGDSSGRVFKMDSGINDNGAAILSFWHGPHYDHGRGSTTKRWRELIMNGQTVGGSINIAWLMDFGIREGGNLPFALEQGNPEAAGGWGQDDWGVADWGGGEEVPHPMQSARVRLRNATGHRLQMRLSSQQLDMTWVMHSWELGAVPIRSRRMERV